MNDSSAPRTATQMAALAAIAASAMLCPCSLGASSLEGWSRAVGESLDADTQPWDAPCRWSGRDRAQHHVPRLALSGPSLPLWCCVTRVRNLPTALRFGEPAGDRRRSLATLPKPCPTCLTFLISKFTASGPLAQPSLAWMARTWACQASTVPVSGTRSGPGHRSSGGCDAGRLEPFEEVHHKNGIRSDNRCSGYIGQNHFLPPRWIRTKSKRKVADYRFGRSLFDLP